MLCDRCVSDVTNSGQCAEANRFATIGSGNYRVIHRLPLIISQTGRLFWYLDATDRVNVERGMILGVAIPSSNTARIATLSPSGESDKNIPSYYRSELPFVKYTSGLKYIATNFSASERYL